MPEPTNITMKDGAVLSTDEIIRQCAFMGALMPAFREGKIPRFERDTVFWIQEEWQRVGHLDSERIAAANRLLTEAGISVKGVN
jgi:hypothetical protein